MTSPKSQDAVALQQIKERGAYHDWSWWISGQAIDCCSNIWASLSRALVMVSSSIRLTAWLQNSKKRAERSERLMYEQSHRVIISALVICIIVCLSRAVNHYRDNAIITKPSATKMPENWSWRTRQLLTCRCVSVMLLRSMQIHEGVSWMLKLKMMLCVMMLPLVVVGCTSKQSVSHAWSHHRLRRG